MARQTFYRNFSADGVAIKILAKACFVLSVLVISVSSSTQLAQGLPDDVEFIGKF